MFFLGACTDSEPPPPASTLATACLEISDAVRADLAPSVPPGVRVMPQLEALERRAREATRGKTAGGAALALAGLIFEEQGFRREVDDEAPQFILLSAVVAGRRGSCVGLSLLYLALAQSAGLPAHAVLAPGHMFVRVGDQGRQVNVELLRMGELMPDGWHAQRFSVPQDVAAYSHPLSEAETLAVLRFNLGNAYRERGKLQRARALYQEATAAFAEFAETWASLGLVQHQLGQLDAADAAYQRAARLHPALPGLEENRKALAASTDQ